MQLGMFGAGCRSKDRDFWPTKECRDAAAARCFSNICRFFLGDMARVLVGRPLSRSAVTEDGCLCLGTLVLSFQVAVLGLCSPE
ncbi:hypothetical protein BDW74DRAFT_148738 [Aspergillus multicolor]|uniref:uncharacterized protein n=1 Tax=Aspergillus multicolor TaxID=41759 RepID=UPI003CCE3CBB